MDKLLRNTKYVVVTTSREAYAACRQVLLEHDDVLTDYTWSHSMYEATRVECQPAGLVDTAYSYAVVIVGMLPNLSPYKEAMCLTELKASCADACIAFYVGTCSLHEHAYDVEDDSKLPELNDGDVYMPTYVNYVQKHRNETVVGAGHFANQHRCLQFAKQKGVGTGGFAYTIDQHTSGVHGIDTTETLDVDYATRTYDQHSFGFLEIFDCAGVVLVVTNVRDATSRVQEAFAIDGFFVNKKQFDNLTTAMTEVCKVMHEYQKFLAENRNV